ncbi:MAG: hypothetical protein IJX66_08335 [Lachnospiraceae bacterium]|nr:hypothetical protein [Lachnospiraceae bacterium]
MGTIEVVLLILGGIIFTVSFLIPSSKADDGTREMVQEEVKNAVAREMDNVKDRIEDLTDETVNYAMEKTERSLERVSNEKIMAVNEYSDTVLEEINKNHKEVMFLYDMLNDKHQNLKTTVSQVEKTVKEAEQKVKEVESTVKEAEKPQKTTTAKKAPKEAEEVAAEPVETKETEKKPAKKTTAKKNSKNAAAEPQGLDISFMKGNRKNGNNNEKILELHNAGKSNVVIAKELGLGVGEVKLVIDLFEGV